MRVHSITEANTRQQQNPFYMQNVNSLIHGKSNSILSFEEHLKSQIQNAKAPVAERKEELLAASYMLGSYALRATPQRSPLWLKGRTYVSQSGN